MKMRKIKQVVCIGMCCVMVLMQAPQNVYALGILSDVKDTVSDMKDAASDIKGEIYESALDVVVDTVSKAWSSFSEDWDEDWGESLINKVYDDAISWFEISGDGALEDLENIFMALTMKIGVDSEKATEFWQRIINFADENNIEREDAAKLALSAIVSKKLKNKTIKKEAKGYIEETVWGWIENSFLEDPDSVKGTLEEQKQDLEKSYEEAIEAAE